MDKKICVVGAGRWGANHIRTLNELGCLAGIVESNDRTREQCRADYPNVQTFASLDEALASDFDGFVVATPAETHFSLGRQILLADKPVLVEKPLAMTAAQARQLKKIADERGVNLMAGHVLLFHPAIRKIRDLIHEGKIGKLQYLYSNRLNLGTVRSEENILWSFAPHDISIFQYFIGRMPDSVVSSGGAFIQPGIHDTTMTVLTYPDNIVGHIFVSWLHPFKEHRLVAIGSKGMISFEDSTEEKRMLFYEKGIDWVRGEPIKRDGAIENIPHDRKMPLTEELRYFVERIGRGPIETADAASAIEVMDILERATASLVLGDEAPPASGAAPSDYFVHPSSFVDRDVEIGAGTKIWHFSHVQSGSRIGKDCSLGQNVNVGNNARIGNRVKIQNNVSIYEGVELEDDVFCGPSAVFTNVRDPRGKYPQRGSEHYKKTLVREGASIGANATVLCGLTIGRHAFVGAGAVLTADAPDYALMVGVPARQQGWVCECGQVLPRVKGVTSCPRCDRRYRLDGEQLIADLR